MGLEFKPSTTKFFKIYLTCVGICLLGVSLNSALTQWFSQQPPLVAEGRIYYHRYGNSYCGGFEAETCGIHLWNCVDEKIYRCLHDVAWKGKE